MRSADRVGKCLLLGVDRKYGGRHENDAIDPIRTKLGSGMNHGCIAAARKGRRAMANQTSIRRSPGARKNGAWPRTRLFTIDESDRML